MNIIDIKKDNNRKDDSWFSNEWGLKPDVDYAKIVEYQGESYWIPKWYELKDNGILIDSEKNK